MGAGAVLCTTGVGLGCFVGAPLAVVGGAAGYEFAKQGMEMATRPYQSTEGERVLDSFDPNREAEGLKLSQDVALIGALGLQATVAGGLGKILGAGVKAGVKVHEKAAGNAVKADASVVNRGDSLLWGSWNDYIKVTIDSKEYAKIGERLYTRHAVDRMQPSSLGTPAGGSGAGRNFPPNLVDEVIRNGKQTTVMQNGIERTIHSSGTAEVITEQKGRIVITVNPFKGGN